MTTDKTAMPRQASVELSDTGREVRGRRTTIAAALGLTVGPSVLAVMSFGAFIAPLHREFGWSVSDIGRAASLLSITVMIISPLQGWLVDRYGGRRLILWTSPVFGLSLMAMYFLPGRLSVFYLAWALIPLCGLGLWPVSYLRLTAGWFERKLGLALGIANSGIGVGTVLVPLLTAWLIASFGWRAAFLGLGAVALLAFPVAFFLITEPSPRATDVHTGGDTLKASARRRPFWLILGAFLLLGLVGSSITVYQIPLLLDAGVPEHIADVVPVALGLALIVARIVTGWLLDRFAASVVMSCNLAGGLVAVLLFAAGPNVVTGLVAAALAGLLIGSEFDVLSYLVPRHFGRMAYGKIYGFAFSAFQIGGAVASSAVSASRERYGSYTPAMLTLAVVCVVCAAVFMSLGPYRYDPAPAQATLPAEKGRHHDDSNADLTARR